MNEIPIIIGFENEETEGKALISDRVAQVLQSGDSCLMPSFSEDGEIIGLYLVLLSSNVSLEQFQSITPFIIDAYNRGVKSQIG